jgi:hypothetical protein
MRGYNNIITTTWREIEEYSQNASKPSSQQQADR